MGVKNVFGGGGAPVDGPYVTVSGDGGLDSERVLTAGTGISLTDGGAGSTLTIAATGGGGGGGGKVLQAVQKHFSGVWASNSLTFGNVTDGSATLEASITPGAATSKVLIIISLNANNNNSGYTGLFRIWNGSAAVGGGVGTEATHLDNVIVNARTAQYEIEGYSAHYLDSPSTTSAITYTVQGRQTNAGAYIKVNQNSRNGNYIQDTPVASSITLLEIGA